MRALRQSTARTRPLQARAFKILSLPAIALALVLGLVALPAVVSAATTPTTTTATSTSTTSTTTTTTTTPAKAPVVIHWNKDVRIEAAKLGGLSAVSCPATNLCAAVDQSGDVVVSNNARGGASSWKLAHVDGTVPLTGISCPTITLCVAVDQNGNVITSIKPTGGASAWSKPVKIDSATLSLGGSVGLTGIDCPTPTLCVAVDGAAKGNVIVSTQPTGGAHAWASATIATGPLTSIDCASATLCVAAGDQHYISAQPAGGAAAWKATGTQLGGGVFSAISCPATTLCIGVGYGNSSTGVATATATPTAGARTWKTVDVEAVPPVPGESLLGAVGCPTTSVCVAVDGTDNAYTTTAPVGGAWSGATPIRQDSAATSSALSCIPTLCVVVDSAGVETTGIVRATT
jgi:hypothetical protein